MYVTFDGASKFSTFEAVSSTGHEKNRYFAPKKHIYSNKKNITKIYQPIFWYNVGFDMTNICYKGISADRCCSSPTALIRNTENWNINVRYTKWVSKYSSDLVGLEKYHNPQFLPELKLKLWRHTQDLFLRSFLYFSWHYSLPSYKISNSYHLF